MIAEWFKQDIDAFLQGNSRVVVVDPNKHAGFLLGDSLKAVYTIYSAVELSDVEELKIKYDIEKNH